MYLSDFSPELKQDSSWVLQDKYGWSKEKITRFWNSPEENEVSAEIKADLQRLENGEPVAYVIGWVDFLGCHIDVSYKPLIPRPETEYWVAKAIRELEARQTDLEVLDVCCGSGCIGIALLKKLHRVNVDFADISSEAIQQTKLNLEKNSVSSDKYRVVHGNLFEKITKQYDLIICNPPYVDREGEWGREVLWEPEEAIFAQKQGIGLIEEIFLHAKKYLRNDGTLIMEFGKDQEVQIKELAERVGWRVEFFPDQYGVTRWLKAR